MDYNGKLREARLLIDKGMFTQAVFTLGNILENLYLDVFNEVSTALPLADKQRLLRREQEFTAKGDKAARDKGFAGLSLGGKIIFFKDNSIIADAERLLNRPLPYFKGFNPDLFRSLRNDITHGRDEEVDEDEASMFYSQMRILLLETGLIQKTEPKQEVVSAGGLHSWKENGVIPHDDILGGNLQMDTYAADLWGVAHKDKNTPAVYRDADKFFAQTYLTHSLHSLLNDVLKVLGGSPGDRVLQLRTPFGGGKTHSLIALYHAVKNRSKIALGDLPNPGKCAVAAIQCEKLSVRRGRVTEDGIHIHTLWGEIAYELGGAAAYEYVRDDDENYTSPGGETLAQLLRDLGQPALILLDEVLNYVETAQTVTIGESTFGRQLMIFLKNLTETVSASRSAVLVYSLQASVREGLGAENLLSTLDHLVSRLDAKREPVSGSEVMRVVQRRLFKNLGDDTAAGQVAAAYAEAYRKARQAAGGLSADEQHQAAQEAAALSERIRDSYPFHPDLLDLMYHRWGTLASYQRTRGALQFLACVVHDLWEKGRDLQPLIGAGDVPLDGDNTRNAFFTQVGEREAYNSVLDADIIGAGARAGRVDRRIASDSPALQRYRVGTRLATCVMLYSFGAREGEERGVIETELIQASTVPGLDRMSQITALNDLRSELLHLHYTGRRYRFETQPNLNKLIDDETKKFDAEEVRRHVRTILEQALATGKGAVIWPETSGAVNDHVPMLQIVYLQPEWANTLDNDQLRESLTRWLEYCGNTRRDYKNGLAFALPNNMASDTLASTAREALAVDSLLRNKKSFSFNPEQTADLNERKNSATDRLKRGMLSLYDRLAVPVPDDTPYSWRFVELQSRNELSPHERIIGALRESHLVFESVTPDKLIALTGLGEAKAIETKVIASGFYEHLTFTRLISSDAVALAIARGVADAKMGYTAVWQVAEGNLIFPNRELVYLGRPLRLDEIDLGDSLILDAEVAREATYVPPVQEDDVEIIPEERRSVPPVITPSTAMMQGSKKRYRLTANADKSKIFKVIRVLQNLVDKSDRVSMQIEVLAETNEDFDPVWIRNAVEEPLDEADVDAQTGFE